uniref:Heme lyase n=1 Tax=Imasa heleensis TaxID=2772037 RepID=A0A893DCJ0_9EUKA|nr:heme lyase [Imasa heleensis]QRR29752.1 heme lyase [Imasa heleensis]
MSLILGHYGLLITLITSLLCFIFYKSDITHKYGGYISFVLFTLTFILYAYSSISCDPSYLSLSNSISSQMPYIYRVGSIWSNHEGSIMLWSYIIQLYAFYLKVSVNIPEFQRTIVLRWIYLILFFFLFYTYFSSNPFLSIYTGQLIDKELNPVLQDPVLIIHPPIIYFGYLGSTLIYSYTLSYLYFNDDKILIELRFIAKYCLSILTLGIVLGSWWAYHELGWGGWWFWDPVENISLLPWFCYVMILHNKPSNDRSIKPRWLLLASFFSFLFSCYGTFFVRSGLIVSVHSFTQGSSRVVVMLLSIILFFMLFSHYYIKDKRKNQSQMIPTVYASNLIILMSLILIFMGTVLPPVYMYMYEKEISIGSVFFDNLANIITLPLLLFILLSLTEIKKEFIKIICHFLVSIIIINFYISRFSLEIGILNQVILITSISIITIHGMHIINRRVNYKRDLAHLSIVLIVIGASLSSQLECEFILSLYPGEKLVFNDMNLFFRDLNTLDTYRFKANYADLLINFKETSAITFPERRFYLQNSNIISKSVILSGLTSDIYLLLGEGNYSDGWYVRILLKPFISFIWLGSLLLAISLLMTNSRKVTSTYNEIHNIKR